MPVYLQLAFYKTFEAKPTGLSFPTETSKNIGMVQWVTKNLHKNIQQVETLHIYTKNCKSTFLDFIPLWMNLTQVNILRLPDTFHFLYTPGTIFSVPTILSDTMLAFIAAATKCQSRHPHSNSIYCDATSTCCMFLTSLPIYTYMGFTLFQSTACAQFHGL